MDIAKCRNIKILP